VSDLSEALANVSAQCLRGEAVPDDLAALWRAQLDDDTDLLDSYEMTLLDAIEPELFDGFREEDGVEPAAARAFERMASQIRWVAEILDGSLVGYWVGEERRRVGESPVVICDPSGQFELGARTLAEYLLDCTEPDDPEEFSEVAEALAELGIDVPVRDHQEIWDRLAGFDDPNSVTMGYLVEERMRG
jgi:hypothetical protein